MKKLSAETVSDAGGRQYHIGCGPGDVAEYVLLVGDPARAEKVSKRFDSIRFHTTHREYVTYTGTYKGIDLTVMATGIGTDNTEIAVIEICQITKQPSFIRCGSSSALQKEMNLGDLIISRAAVRLDNTTSYFVHDGYPAVADTDITLALAAGCHETKAPFHVGITASAPGFYGPQGRKIPGFPLRFPDLPEDLGRMNVANFEMEASALFVLASLRGVRAGAVCAAFGNRPKNVFADERMRTASEKRCIDASLAAFLILKKMDAERVKRKLPIWIPA